MAIIVLQEWYVPYLIVIHYDIGSLTRFHCI